MDKQELEYELENLDKKKLITLFLKLKDINLKMGERNALLEDQLDDLTDFDTLLKSVK